MPAFNVASIRGMIDDVSIRFSMRVPITDVDRSLWRCLDERCGVPAAS